MWSTKHVDLFVVCALDSEEATFIMEAAGIMMADTLRVAAEVLSSS